MVMFRVNVRVQDMVRVRMVFRVIVWFCFSTVEGNG